MYWVADSKGRVLGPTHLDTVRELVAAGRLVDIAQVSRDGRSWMPVAQVPEILQLQSERTPEAVASWEGEQLRTVRAYLHQIQSQAPHEIFKLPESASLAEYRAAFFGTVKRFYPDRQPEGELRRACENVFLYLSSLMVNLERSQRSTPLPPPVITTPRPPITSPAVALPQTPRPPTTSPNRPLLRGREAPSYEPAEFVGLKWANERVEARLRIRRKHVPMFTDHPLANFNMNSVFVPGTNVVPLGTLMELVLQFEAPDGEVQTRGKVFWENSGNDPRQPSGFGVRLFTLNPRDQEFIRAYIRGR